MSFLSEISPGDHLRNVKIYVDVFGYKLGGMDWRQWEEGDSVLASSRFPLLELVHINLKLLYADDAKYPSVIEELTTCLPLLKAHGILNICHRSNVDVMKG
jgi:hypothetical protein